MSNLDKTYVENYYWNRQRVQNSMSSYSRRSYK
nr:MAG TPA: hypothetical protein [Caudoviricetes sp.]